MSAPGGDFPEAAAAGALAALVDAYAAADAEVKAAEDRRKDLRDQLMLAAAESPNQSPASDTLTGTRAVVQISRVESWRVNTSQLKAEHPEVYVAYARKSTSWRLTVTPR